MTPKELAEEFRQLAKSAEAAGNLWEKTGDPTAVHHYEGQRRAYLEAARMVEERLN